MHTDPYVAPPLDVSSVIHGGIHHPVLRSYQDQGRSLNKSMLMYPIFISDDPDAEQVISSLPGQKRWGINKLEGFLGPLVSKGLKSVILFGVPEKMIKDERGSAADDPNTPVILALKHLSALFPHLFLAVDVCLCEYTSHGHCGIQSSLPHPAHSNAPSLDADASAQRIADVAVAYAKAGAHCVAPSDMMDGRIRAIKMGLIHSGYGNRCTLMSYAAKFASGLYGPFREAAGSTPMFGDRKCYQLPPNGRGIARRAVRRDISEGADIIMVKPALPYLDVISDAQEIAKDLPIACYQVSGEYAMIYAGAEKGIYDLKQMAFETTESMVRAGAGIILSYFTPEFLDWLEQ
ncbi:putative porphobilinogen synthase [Kockovaella imperatae]|uniref:Delta-aminolevulinic acid dehydratase n=1 Tax=Kockovaella imperatae TaxID=4999 RepID=A0A1Y1UCK6_9TREE|nr:putative porphobilinogen synthase [Kockovaella imperatae]ORX35780.1 putative porphobilinogen synthase [Kockovaella imperatae]